MPSYQYVFIAAGVGMLISLIWFYFGRRQLRGIGAPPAEAPGLQRVAYVVDRLAARDPGRVRRSWRSEPACCSGC